MNSTESKSTCLNFSHQWTIDNFAYLYDKTCPWKWSVESEVFTVPGNEDLAFSLSLCPKRKGNDGEEYLGVALFTEEIPDMWEGRVTVEERRCIVDGEGTELLCKESVKSEVFTNKWTFDPEYVPVERLLDLSAGFLEGGTLRVLYEMTLHCPEAIFTSPNNAHTFSHTSIPSSVSSLSHSFTLFHFKWLCEDRRRQMPLRVASNYFAPHREDIGKMRVEFWPKGGKGSEEDENVEIVLFSENKRSLNVHVECFLLNADGGKCHTFEATYRIQPKSGSPYSVPRWNLLSLLDSLPTDQLTINCHVTVLAKGEEQERAVTPTTTTHLDLALFAYHYVPFTWTIERFHAQLQRHSADSKAFSPSTDSRYKFHLRLYPNADSENVILALGFVSPYSIEESTVNWRYSVVDTKGNEWNVRVGTSSFSEPAELGPHEFISHRTLGNFASLLVPEDKLTIKCELWIHAPRKELPPELLNPPSANDSAWNYGCSVFCGWLVSCFG